MNYESRDSQRGNYRGRRDGGQRRSGSNRGGYSQGGYGQNGYSQGRRSGYGGRSRYGGGRRGRGRFKGAPISHDRYVSKAVITETKPYVSDITFDTYNFHPSLHSNIKSKGYSRPTEVQEKTINEIMAGRNVLGISSTGSGKTAAFLIPSVNKMLADRNQKLLVIAPTRELAMQIESEAFSLVRNTQLRTSRVIGGESIGRQASYLRRRPEIVIGTPGRLKDMHDRKALYLNEFNNIVLDEVDRMLDMGFVDDIQFLISQISQERQALFFSATIDQRVESIASGLASDFVSIKLSENQTAQNVAQDIVKVTSYQDKIEKLHDMLNREDVNKTLIFVETKREVDKVERQLRDRGFAVAGIHGDKSQSKRKRIIQDYRNNAVKILLATNVVARGLDVKDITHVINFDEPESYDEYIHRIGRTGRNGRSGQAYTFVY
ncbi:MAG: DEAD/DEAH box helicase [Candidatus Dojkabacteria bacterium]|nr:MAG: DEAD/DEAH box helicase [Candidatus Dojkabacteria bacterium]